MSQIFLGVDPGLATGVAVVELDDDGLTTTVIDSREIPPEAVAPYVRYTLERYPELTVVCEAYIITVETAKKSRQYYSLELIGILKQCMRDVNMKPEEPPVGNLVMHKPSAKSVISNKQLQAVKLWHRGGAGHANDALRHIAVRLVNIGWRDRRLLG